MARDVTARDSKSETTLLDRRSARWHAGSTSTATDGRETATSPGANPADETTPAGTPTLCPPGRASGAEVRDGS
ncbi:hypothetical protein M0R89_17730 [Halorussus limi]|uniref:Uncharacterized protein n=1 Tax=Halorussus limi TaxID=2938695 RepID=A0A8U0HUC3_9EURY|nr:hypothetical protein [Halorussus limi]UPV74361.1 hypothetical protein M0R89_17730 [Halorussus limi]